MVKRLVGWATAIIVFGVLFAQTKSTDHVPDLVIWSCASALLIPAVVKAWKQTAGSNTAIILFFVSGGELLLCIYVIFDIARHLHSL